MSDMEKNGIVCHGSSAIAQERLLYSSDPFTTVICNTCGFFAEKAAPEGTLSVTHKTNYCRHCNSHENIYNCEMPYAAKLFMQEITALHLKPQFELE